MNTEANGANEGTIRSDRVNNSHNERNKKKKFLLLLLLLLVFLTGIGFYALRPKPEALVGVVGSLGPGKGEVGHLPGMSEEEIRAQLQKVVDENTISFKLNARPVFEDGKSPGTLQIENPIYNAYPMVVAYHLVNSDGTLGKEIYNSGGIFPNEHINLDTLDVALESGMHTAIAVMTFYHPETFDNLAEQQAEVIITVNNWWFKGNCKIITMVLLAKKALIYK